MFGILVLFLKLFFSMFFSILFSYFIIEEEKNNLGVVLFGIAGVSLTSIVMSFSDSNANVSISLSIIAIIYLSYIFFNIADNNQKLLFIFPGTIGCMIGLGLIFESLLILGSIYIAKNSLNYIYESNNIDNDAEGKQENNE